MTAPTNEPTTEPETEPTRMARSVPIIAGCAALLVVVSIARAFTGGGAEAAIFPLLLAIGEGVAALLLWRRHRWGLVAAAAMLFLTGLLHVVVVVGSAQWWLRVLSLVVLVASVYAGYLLMQQRAVTVRGKS